MSPRSRVVGSFGTINKTENHARCNEGLAPMSGEVYVRFIAHFSLFHCAQGPLCGRKPWSSHLKFHSSIQSCGFFRYNKQKGEPRSLQRGSCHNVRQSQRAIRRALKSLSPHTRPLSWTKIQVELPEMSPRSSGFTAASRCDKRDGELRSLKRGTSPMSGEVEVRFTALLSRFHRV
jgi:hypothetical protein